MFPGKPLHNPTNGRTSNTKYPCQTTLAHARSVLCAYLEHLIGIQSRPCVFVAPWPAVKVPTAGVAIPRGRAPTLNHFAAIIGVIAQMQMFRAYTGRVIARMQHQCILWNVAVCPFVRQAVCVYGYTAILCRTIAEATVACTRTATRPNPTSIRLLDIRPKARANRFGTKVVWVILGVFHMSLLSGLCVAIAAGVDASRGFLLI